MESRPRRRRRGNVPADLTAFVGRRADVADVKGLLATSRFVSLVGPGGVGKTRLVLRIAAELRRAFVDGVWFVELADLRAREELPQAIATALGVAGDEPATAETLADRLHDRRMLLILDNCEHLVEACAELVSELLRAASELRVLTTTRQPLRASGELIHLVGPLEYPDPRLPLPPGASAQFSAMALFVDRARAVVPDFAVTPENEDAVAQLCQRLEGMPLSIELAALSLRVLSVPDLADRLADPYDVLTTGQRTAPSRHASLEAAVDWSYRLCTAPERALWAQCSVFAGHFDHDAAVAVCIEDATSPDDVLGMLAGLVDKSVLSREEHGGSVRFSMSETMRAYGARKLADLDLAERLHDRHLAYYESLLERAVFASFGPDQERWLIALQLDHANVRAALDRATATKAGGQRAMRLATQAWFYWTGCGYLREGAQWLERALESDLTPSAERANALWAAGLVAALQGRVTAAEEYAADSERAAAAVPRVDVRAHAAHVRGLAALFGGDLGLAGDRLAEAADLYVEADVDDALSTLIEVDRAIAYLFDGRAAAAADAIERCRQACVVRGDRWVLSHALLVAALAEYLRGDLGTAAALVEESLTTKRRFHDVLGVALGLDLQAWVAAASSESDRAAVLLGAAHRQWTVVGEPLFGSKHFTALRAKAEETARLGGDPSYEDGYARGAAFELEQAVAYALREPEPLDVDVEGADLAVGLTRRESQVAELVGRGLSNKEIAATLVISQRTAEGHVQRILTKFGFTSRAQVATWVAEQRQPGSN
jgi:predicted ATPase/DNA-binding CsgD family transcriptional regulator